jgi:site-specific DNA-cytosine methylase
MNVLSLFDGMSCLQIALKELNINYGTYYASEIDKYAINQTQLNFPNTIQLGSVTEWQTWDIDWSKIGLIGTGSPCQGFSFAGKQLAFDDERSKLFFVFVDILNHAKKFNPEVKFLFENVNMKKSHMKVINDYLGLHGVNINSNLVSAQNRNRWYWSNIRTKRIGLFGDLVTDIPQPKDRGILLRDILEDGKTDREKSFCIDANYFKGGSLKIYLEKSRRQLVLRQSESRLMVKMNNKYRMLTPLECAKLQTIPSWYKWNCSETQQYKMLGNGWTNEVIKHILKYINL